MTTMISSDTSCSQLVAGNYDVLVEDDDDDEEEEEEEHDLQKKHDHDRSGEQGELKKGKEEEKELGLQNGVGDIHDDDDDDDDDDDENSDEELKLILGNYLKKFEFYEANLFQNRNNINDCNYANEFKILKEYSKNLKENKANLQQGEEEFNLKKNRYKDIIPFEHTRVILKPTKRDHDDDDDDDDQDDLGSSYINANYIRGPSGKQEAYIACQGPLVCTLNDFWRMIWECQVSIIVMACNEFESGKPKCELYWPQEIETSSNYGNIHVTLVRVRQINADFLIRKFSIKLLDSTNSKFGSSSGSITNSGDAGSFKVLAERTICQFHYTTWPDHGAPDSMEAILELIRLIREVQPTDCRPILVHCSAGCGRTGTICCIDYVWGLLRRRKLPLELSLFDIINEMRQQRMAMVQTLEQYILCHRVVAALFINHLKTLNSSDELLKLNNRQQNNYNTNNGIDMKQQQQQQQQFYDKNNDDKDQHLKDQTEFGLVLI